MLTRSEPKSSKVILSNGTVLLVDDDVSHANVASGLILAIGFEVIVANGGEEAVREYLAHAGEIVLVLMNVAMPGMGGLEATRLIRKSNPEAKVILSAGNWEFFPADLAEAEADAFLPKPYSYADLRIIFQHVLHRRPHAQPDPGAPRRELVESD